MYQNPLGIHPPFSCFHQPKWSQLLSRFSESVVHVIPLLEPLSKDGEAVVRQHLVEQLKSLAKVCCSILLLQLCSISVSYHLFYWIVHSNSAARAARRAILWSSGAFCPSYPLCWRTTDPRSAPCCLLMRYCLLAVASFTGSPGGQHDSGGGGSADQTGGHRTARAHHHPGNRHILPCPAVDEVNMMSTSWQRLAHEDDREDMRMTASQLLNLLAESLGQVIG